MMVMVFPDSGTMMQITDRNEKLVDIFFFGAKCSFKTVEKTKSISGMRMISESPTPVSRLKNGYPLSVCSTRVEVYARSADHVLFNDLVEN
ncbi:hypothetical protein EVAR_37424_1 [Eumeta japonica]|uniref:Uncharacterized protein n=1 Tax=Eumeta variegata TaxID=151549 RepID=A0A4C1WGL4_EUMVA|nr:hypothetical protein EVAR_37424_1 [Eumeta japonica]